MEEPYPEVDDIGRFDIYIGVTVKLYNETNSGGNIVTVKWSAINSNRSAIGQARNNPLLDTE